MVFFLYLIKAIMKPSALNKKLKSYSALAGSIVAIGSQSDAQVVYTDINPDSTVTVGGSSYFLDLDNDGNFDFAVNLNIGSGSYTSQQVAISPIGSNAIAGDTVGAYVYPFAFNNGDTIQSGLQFNMGSNQSMASYFGPGYFYGNWSGVTDKYAGLYFYIGTQIHYGWARLDIDSTADQFTIKDYAYNTVADEYILAGETGVGIIESTNANDLLIYSLDKNIVIKFLKEGIAEGKISISNMPGQVIHTSEINDKQITINLEKEKTGIYFITVAQKNGTYTKKIYLR